MSTNRDRGFRFALAGAIATAVTGLGLILWSRHLPVFIVPFDEAMRTYEAICPIPGERYDASAYERYSALFGWRYGVSNAGVSLLAGALTSLAGLSLLAHGASRSELTALHTPSHRWQFIALGLAAMLSLWIGSIRGLDTDLSRQYFPICADSIGIPIFGLTVALLVAAPILAILGLLVTRGFGTLPTPLTQWDADRPRRSWSVSAVFLTLALLNVGLLAMGILSSDIVLPAGVLTTYLLLATRAALLAPPRTVSAS